MTDETFQTTAPVVQQSPADSATEHAVNVYLGGNPEMVQGAFDRASVEHRRSAPPETGATPDPTWRDGTAPLAQMPDAPKLEAGETKAAIAKLQNLGGDHAALVEEWQTTGANVGEELAYAKSAYRSIVANDPDLIAAVDAAQLGNHPSVLKFLAKQGRLDAGMSGDFTIARNNSNSTPAFTPAPFTNRAPAAPMGNSRGSEETRQELNRLINENGPGTERYKDPAVQNRIQHLHQMLAGSASSIVGRSGRTS